MERFCLTTLLVLTLVAAAGAQSAGGPSFLGFDRNTYPGDENLEALRQTFIFTGYWLNNPPGEHSNTWKGKRQKLGAAGFGFLVLFNGRLDAALGPANHAARLGKSDAQAAASAARKEGFPGRTIIFLDQEQGGRMLPEQKAYIYAWVDGIVAAGFRAGIYCSGISGAKDGGEDIVTANDIAQSAAGRKIVFFVTNDACPPSPGCEFPEKPPSPIASGIDFAGLWQFAQSPRRKDIAAGCHNYNSDGECYPPKINAALHLHVDVDSATSDDPSHGRTH